MTEIKEYPLPPDFDALKNLIRSLSRTIYVQTEDPGRWLDALKITKTIQDRTVMYAPFLAAGQISLADYRGRFGMKRDETGTIHRTPLQFLEKVLAHNKMDICVYGLTNVLVTPEVAATVRQIHERATENEKWVTLTMFFNGEPLPTEYRHLFDVVVDRGPSPEEVGRYVTGIMEKLCLKTPVSELVELCRGLSFYQIDTLICRTVIANKQAGQPPSSAEIAFDTFKVVRASQKGAYET